MKSTLIVIYCLGCFAALGGGDSLVRYSDLKLSSEFEKEIFRNYRLRGQAEDMIDIFIPQRESGEPFKPSLIRQRINEAVDILQNETSRLNEKKRVKVIFKYVEGKFLKLYKSKVSFSDIFEKGHFNCVSGSALYAIIFSRLNIPFTVVESPGHVFLFAYPQTHRILIESTSIKEGYIPFSESFMDKFVKYLRSSRLVSEQEVAKFTAAELFDRYYFERAGTTIENLASFQYSNYAIYAMEENNYERALPRVQQAYYISPSYRNRYLLMNTVLTLLSNSSYLNDEQVNYLELMCRFNNANKKDFSDEAVSSEFKRLTYSQLVSRGDKRLYTRSYRKIMSSISDTILKSEIAFIYHYEIAWNASAHNWNADTELVHLKAAYAINNTHEYLRQQIVQHFSQRFGSSSNVPMIILKLEEYEKDFSFVRENVYFNQVRANCMLEQAYQMVTLNRIAQAEATLKEFEMLCKRNNALTPGENLVEKAYGSQGMYYYKRGDSNKARQAFTRGMEYAPNSFGLMMRINQLK